MEVKTIVRECFIIIIFFPFEQGQNAVTAVSALLHALYTYVLCARY